MNSLSLVPGTISCLMDSVVDELSVYRFGALEHEVKQLLEANHEMANSISSLMIQITNINDNITRLAGVSNTITERIHVLENDLQERAIRKKVYKSLLAYYPIILFLMVLLFNLDNHKISEILSYLKILIPH